MRILRCEKEGCKLKMAEKGLIPTREDYLLPIHSKSKAIKTRKKTAKGKKAKVAVRKNKRSKTKGKRISRKRVAGRKRRRRTVRKRN